MYFKEYGELEWLEPEEFYAGPWKLFDMAEGEDGEMYNILLNDRENVWGELRYSAI